MAKKLEGKIKPSEVRKAIRSMANGKAPGPDGLHAEMYKANEGMFSKYLTKLFNEMHAEGRFPETMKSAVISLLFKKNDP